MAVILTQSGDLIFGYEKVYSNSHVQNLWDNAIHSEYKLFSDFPYFTGPLQILKAYLHENGCKVILLSRFPPYFKRGNL